MIKNLLERLLYAFVLIFFVLIIIYGNFVRGPYLYQLPSLFLLFYALLGAGIFLAVYWLLRKLIFLQNPLVFIPLLSSLTFAPRYIWVRLIHTVPMIDFLRFHNYALALIEGDYNAYLDIRNVFPHLSGYPLILSYIYRIFGTSPKVALWFNVFCSIGTAILIYLLGREIFNEVAGQMAGLIFAFYPTQIMYNTLVASEHIFLLLFLLALYLFIRFTRVELVGWEWLKLLIVGLVMVLAHIVRPVSSLLFVPMLAYLLFFQRSNMSLGGLLKEKLIIMFLIVVSFSLVLGLVNFAYIDKVKVPLGKTGSGFNLYVGTDPERDGMWNPTAWEIIEDYDHDFDRVHGEAQRRAIERIKDDPVAFIALAERKFPIQWATDDYGYYWSMLEVYPETAFGLWIEGNLDLVKIISQSYYMAIVLLATLGAWYSLTRGVSDPASLPAMLILIFGAAHLLIEVQSRYHHPVVPFFILIGAMALTGMMGDLEDFSKGGIMLWKNH